jgi:hypothetical protein
VTSIRNWLRYEPAILAWLANGGVAALAAFVLHFTHTQEAATVTVLTALAAIFTAIQARPVNVSVLTGALTVIATAAAAFGLHLPPAEIASGVSIVSTVLALMFRANLTPKAALHSVNAAPAAAPIP